MNPLDIAAEQSIRLIANVKPLRITYNAVSNVTILSPMCSVTVIPLCIVYSDNRVIPCVYSV